MLFETNVWLLVEPIILKVSNSVATEYVNSWKKYRIMSPKQIKTFHKGNIPKYGSKQWLTATK